MRRAKARIERDPASFRDPSGFVFYRDGVVYRQVNRAYQEQFDLLIQSNLHERLVESGLLLPHEEADIRLAQSDRAYRVLEPEPLQFVSYPYEWCFSQLRDAALLTLKAQLLALEHGMTLKDASGYNVQFQRGRPILIDTLSFERYEPGSPWIAYRQFCEHFLAPLALMSYRDARLGQLLQRYIDGVPIDLASRLLPRRTRWMPRLLFNIHLHAKSQRRYADRPATHRKIAMKGLLGLLDSLQSAVAKLRYAPTTRGWTGYYSDTNYSETAFERKRELVAGMIERVAPATVWDLGANEGVFSRVAADSGAHTIAIDLDHDVIERAYDECRRAEETKILPLVIDLRNPTPGTGWAASERLSLSDRGPADLVMALALIHHLAIGNNTPLPQIASYFSRLGRQLVIEFVPKSDSQVERLLRNRQDIFDEYDERSFRTAFERHFEILAVEPITSPLLLRRSGAVARQSLRARFGGPLRPDRYHGSPRA